MVSVEGLEIVTVTGSQGVSPTAEVVMRSEEVVVIDKVNELVIPVIDSVPNTVLVTRLERVTVVVGSGVLVGERLSVTVTVPQLQGVVDSASAVEVMVGVSVKVVGTHESQGGATVGEVAVTVPRFPVCEA